MFLLYNMSVHQLSIIKNSETRWILYHIAVFLNPNQKTNKKLPNLVTHDPSPPTPISPKTVHASKGLHISHLSQKNKNRSDKQSN